MNLDVLDPQEKQQMFLGVLNDWRSSRSLILLEMLKQVAEPLLKNEISKHRDSGIRQEDLRRAAEGILLSALDSYSPSSGPLIEWLQERLTSLGQKIPDLRSMADSQRGK